MTIVQRPNKKPEEEAKNHDKCSIDLSCQFMPIWRTNNSWLLRTPSFCPGNTSRSREKNFFYSLSFLRPAMSFYKRVSDYGNEPPFLTLLQTKRERAAGFHEKPFSLISSDTFSSILCATLSPMIFSLFLGAISWFLGGKKCDRRNGGKLWKIIDEISGEDNQFVFSKIVFLTLCLMMDFLRKNTVPIECPEQSVSFLIRSWQKKSPPLSSGRHCSFAFSFGSF